MKVIVKDEANFEFHYEISQNAYILIDNGQVQTSFIESNEVRNVIY